MLESLAETRVEIKPFLRMERGTEHVGIGIPGTLMPNAFEAIGGSSLQRFQYRCGIIAQLQIGMTDDRGTRPNIAIKAACSLGGDAIHKLDFANDLHRVAGPSAIKCAAFHEHRSDNVVATGNMRMELVECVMGIRQQGLEEVVPRLREHPHQRTQIPQMMVRIDDRQVGFDNLFGHCESALSSKPGAYGN